MIYINISIDTENKNTPFYNGDYKESILFKGTQQVVHLLKQYDLDATFFLSIFEYYKVSNEEIQNTVNLIKDYEVGLHTHPLWIDKENMHSYSLHDQIKLIKQGINLFEKFGLPKPTVHRAGAYGLDKNTIIALQENGIFIDSSMFYSHPNCKEVWTKNIPVKQNDFIELPVTIFHRKMYDLDNKLINNKIVKTDINSMFFDEFVHFIDFCQNNNLNYINLFMHSYSFINNIRDQKKFIKIIEYIKNHNNITVLNLNTLAKEDIFNKNDTIPTITRVFDHTITPQENF